MKGIAHAGRAAYIGARESRQEPYFLVDIVRFLRKLAIGYRKFEGSLWGSGITVHC